MGFQMWHKYRRTRRVPPQDFVVGKDGSDWRDWSGWEGGRKKSVTALVGCAKTKLSTKKKRQFAISKKLTLSFFTGQKLFIKFKDPGV